MIDEIRSRELLERVSKGSLLFQYKNVHSQIGQDGILEEIFKRVGIKKVFFVSLVHGMGFTYRIVESYLKRAGQGFSLKLIKKSFLISNLTTKILTILPVYPLLLVHPKIKYQEIHYTQFSMIMVSYQSLLIFCLSM